MRRVLVLLSIVGLVLLALSSYAEVIRSSSPGLTISNTTGLCTNTVDGAGGPTDTIVYPETGTITDVNVRTEIDHTWRGDLQFHVSYAEGAGGSGQAVLALDDGGSGEDDYYATFDDGSSNGPCDTVCGGGSGTTCSASGPTDCVPDEALSVFNGLTSPGTWTIQVCDDASGDDGTLQLWEMTVDGTGQLPVELVNFSVE